MSVCEGFELSRRRDKLTFSHHQEVQGRPDADELLDWCEETTPPRSRNQLRERKKEIKKKLLAQKAAAMIDADSAKSVTIGDWWQLGDHLLYCGDTSQNDFIERLEKAAFCFADPPYGAGKEGYDDSVFYWEHDYLIDIGEVVAVTPGIVSIFEFAKRTEMPYLWSVACWINNGMTRGAMGFGNWIYAAVFSRGSVYRNSQDFFQISISLADHQDTTHTTRKPAKYMVWLIEVFAKKGELVIDPFAGSGQTLMACEVTGRRCMTGELDPKFCSSIIARWEAMTGRQAVKL
jgi:predicted RNA methylase